MGRLGPRSTQFTFACSKSTKAGGQVCFPLAEQAALLLLQTEGRKDEPVGFITSVEPWRLDATNWLRLNRESSGRRKLNITRSIFLY
jgi:cell division FtsZ-interacting protein ZapD